MTIDVNLASAELLGTERHLTLSQAAAALPGQPHLSTLHRWRLRGVRGIRLETCLIGGRRFTTEQWLRDFIEATSKADSDDSSPSQPSQLPQAAFKSAESEVAREGN